MPLPPTRPALPSYSPSPSCCIYPPIASVSIRIWVLKAQLLLNLPNDLAAYCTIPGQKESCPHYLPWPYDRHLLNFNLSASNVLARIPEAKTFCIPRDQTASTEEVLPAESLAECKQSKDLVPSCRSSTSLIHFPSQHPRNLIKSIHGKEWFLCWLV